MLLLTSCPCPSSPKLAQAPTRGALLPPAQSGSLEFEGGVGTFGKQLKVEEEAEGERLDHRAMHGMHSTHGG